MPSHGRRDFLKAFATTAAALPALTAAGAADRPNERVLLAVMGLRSRGKDHIRTITSLDGAEIAYLIDADENMVPAAMKALAERQKREPKVVKDVRQVLEDKDLTALTIAAPDHWHALATIW